eukprot:946937-Pleurochrysis_carterae.AAC.1
MGTAQSPYPSVAKWNIAKEGEDGGARRNRRLDARAKSHERVMESDKDRGATSHARVPPIRRYIQWYKATISSSPRAAHGLSRCCSEFPLPAASSPGDGGVDDLEHIAQRPVVSVWLARQATRAAGSLQHARHLRA